MKKYMLYTTAFASLMLMSACNSTSDSTINGRLKDEYGWKGSAAMPAGVVGYEAPTTRAKAEAEPAKPEVKEEVKTVQPEKKQAVPAAEKIYTVKQSDTLSSIAKKEYKRASAWDIIYNANKDVLKNNPNKIRPGMKLRIPALNSGK